MPVRKTESRIPAGLTAADLGQTATATGNANLILVSHYTNVAIGQEQHYTVIVADPALAPTADQYEWTFTPTGSAAVTRTGNNGNERFTPANAGAFSVRVRILNASSAPIGEITLNQTVNPLNAELENLIDQANARIPVAANPPVSREVINNIRPYVDALIPVATNEVENRMLLCLIYATCLRLNPAARLAQLNAAADTINNNAADTFVSNTQSGLGICSVRPYALAMFRMKSGTTPFIPVSNIPESGRPRSTAITALHTAFNAATNENEKIDFYNLLRFPKAAVSMAKMLLEGLRDRNYSGMEFREVFNDANKSKLLLTQYEKGPMAISASSRPSTFGNQVHALMNQMLWQIATVGYTPITGPNSVITSYRVGEPEDLPVPPVVYIIQGGGGFADTAVTYHQTYGFQVERYTSIENLVTRISADNFTINRFRFIAHAHPSNVGCPFFENSSPFTTREYLEGFGQSDVLGLKTILGTNLDPAQYHFGNDYVNTILDTMRQPARVAQLTPFNLQNPGSTPSGDLAEFIRISNDLNFIRIATITVNGNPLADRASLTAAYTFISEALIPALAVNGITEAQLRTLRTTIAGLTVQDLQFTGAPSISFNIAANAINMFVDVREAMRAIGQNFRTKLNATKARFDTNSFIDLRGCRFGQQQDNLTAMQTFFGRAGHLPHTSSPEWFQSFSTLGFQTFGGTNDVNNLFQNGINASGTAFSSASVGTAFDSWKALMLLPDQLDFLITKFDIAQTTPFEFLTFRWAEAMPNLKMVTPRVEELPALGFRAKLDRLKELFDIANFQLPATMTMNRLEILHNQSVQLATIQPRLTGSLNNAEFPAVYNQLVAVAAALNQAALVPSTPPAPLGLAELQSAAGNLQTYLNTEAGALNAFRAALLAEANQGTNSQFRYFFRAGLPLIVPVIQAPGVTPVGYYLFCLNAHSNAAVRSFMKAQWEGAMPASNQIASAVLTSEPARMVSMLTMHQDPDNSHSPVTECYISPMTEYDQHITSI